ncbi:MAG: dethiobiotin synthase [Alphaproteobacteria bacterium]|nr:dethiobiotin synthase [Alphaproteobacteria bacterium]
MQLFMTGTDTNVGKTVASAWLALHLRADYWKPIETGADEGSDAHRAAALAALPEQNIWKPVYRLHEPLSPHEAAKRAGVKINLGQFLRPNTARNLVVEGIGGVMVPLNDRDMVADLIRHLGLPAVLVARSGLGTINHSVLSLRALRRFEVPVMGVIMTGTPAPHNREAIEQFGKTRVLAEIPLLDEVTTETLRAIKPRVPFDAWVGT